MEYLHTLLTLWLVALALLIPIALGRSGIRWGELFRSDRQGPFLADRIQLAVFWLAGLGAFTSEALSLSRDELIAAGSLPDVSPEFVAAFAASQGIYISGKVARPHLSPLLAAVSERLHI